MGREKHFIEEGIKKLQIEELLAKELVNSGYGGVELQNTHLGTQIRIKTSRPGIVIGKKGARIRELTQILRKNFDFEIPHIDVQDIEDANLDPQIMAEKVAYGLEKGDNYRRTAYGILRRVMYAGSRGAEITISGQVSSQRARRQVFRQGIISRCGQPATEGVMVGKTSVTMKNGVIGIVVKVMPSSYKLPGEIRIKQGVEYKKIKKPTANDPIYEVDEQVERSLDEISSDVEEETIFDENEESVVEKIISVSDDGGNIEGELDLIEEEFSEVNADVG